MAIRSHLTLLLLLNYLLVIGVGLVERPVRVIDRPFAYVHSHDCQLQHTLRLACFDDCNGVQYQVKKTGARPPLQQLLNTLKGLDKHCLPEARMVASAPVFRLPQPRVAVCEVAVPMGHHGQIELPPCRG
ncbi:hypothetical protein [Hymenobacter glacialis]|uniref:Uncharacterized protein n=1 Tax=Hymenobacter glacialis TaxID=1908236 RepID=A0A1G1SWH5_9BACT|nr:hypothetical protein [Hymenobacter glacialis]OGX82981.1 hypothetical protein BEN48_04270 [Hymenobacter glacialis]